MCKCENDFNVVCAIGSERPMLSMMILIYGCVCTDVCVSVKELPGVDKYQLALLGHKTVEKYLTHLAQRRDSANPVRSKVPSLFYKKYFATASKLCMIGK